MKPIQLEYAEAQGLRQLVYRLHSEFSGSNYTSLVMQCNKYIKMLDTKINEAVMKDA